VALDNLCTADGQEATEEAIRDPAQWAVYMSEEWGYFDAATGHPVDEDDVDDETPRNEDLEPEEGLRHYSTVVERTVFVPDWYCLDYVGAGLQLGSYLQSVVSGGRARPNPRSEHDDGEDAQAQAQREADEAAAARRERRKVLVLNRLGEAAAVVRREYVTKLLARRRKARRCSSRAASAVTATSWLSTRASRPQPSCWDSRTAGRSARWPKGLLRAVTHALR
jgi:ParB family transcriptional regulator, chromosome partitioning protein